MIFSVEAQLWAILYSVLVGIAFGIMYDALRISRILLGLRKSSIPTFAKVKFPLIGYLPEKNKTPPGAGVIVFLGDILFSFVCIFVFLVFVFHANFGDGRWFLITGCGLGFFLYFATAGKAVMKISGNAAYLIRIATAYILWLLTLPLRLVMRYVLRPLKSKLKRFISEKRTDFVQRGLERELRLDFPK